MVKKVMTLVALLALVAMNTPPAASQARDARSVVAAASKASGYDNLNTVEYIGSGFGDGGVGQAQSPTAGWHKLTLKNYSRFIDYGAGTSQRNALSSRPLDTRGQLPGGGGLAAVAEAPSTTNIAANGTWTQKLEINLSPPGFLKLAANAANATVYNQNSGGKRYTVVAFPVAQTAPSGVAYRIAGYINDQNMVEKVETSIEDAGVIGDMLVEQTYSGYRDFNGVKFPTRIVQKRAGLTFNDFTITDVKANGMAPAPLAQPGGRGGAGGGRGAAPGGAAPGGGRGGAADGGGARGAGAAPGGAPAAGAPQGRGGAPGAAPGGAAPGGGRGGAPAAGQGGGGARGGGAAAAVGNRKLGDNIYLITGGYRTLAVEFEDHVVMIDAPQNGTPAMIAEIKRLFPTKPIKYVINTHAHFDHMASLRLAIAEGATLMTHQMNKDMYEDWFDNPRTLAAGQPDELTKSGKKLKIETVGEKKVLKDDLNTIELYHLRDVSHAEDMLIVYLPKIKSVFEADAWNPPAADAPAPQPAQMSGLEKHFASEMDRLKIDYAYVIPAHGPGGGDRDVTKAELMKRVGR